MKGLGDVIVSWSLTSTVLAMNLDITWQLCLVLQAIAHGQWCVLSQTSSTAYTIKALRRSCPEQMCTRPCTQKSCVFLCRHMYSCSCPDFEFGHLCKHVHAVHLFRSQDIGSEGNGKEGQLVGDWTCGCCSFPRVWPLVVH